MKHKKLAVVFAGAALLVGTVGTAAQATADGPEGSGGSAENPRIVESPNDVPAGAVEDKTSTYITENKCDETRSWVLTTPGEAAVHAYQHKKVIPAKDAVTHTEYRFPYETRTATPAVEGTMEYLFRKITPAQKEVGNEESRYERTVDTFKTEHQWEKHVKGNKYSVHTGAWAGSFDYRDYPAAGPVWSDGGSGPHHDQWRNDSEGVLYVSTHFKYVKTGVTREVKTGTKTETSGWVNTPPAGDGWEHVESRWVVISPATEEVTEYSEWTSDPSAYPAPWEQSGWRWLNDIVTTPAGFTPWKPGGFTDWSESDTPPANTDLIRYGSSAETKQVEDEAAVPERTVYYVEGGEPSDNVEDASWVEEAELEGWTQFNKKTVTEAVPPIAVHFAWSDNAACEAATSKKPKEVLPQTGMNATAAMLLAGIAAMAAGSGILVGRRKA